jgi:hypothetical protein
MAGDVKAGEYLDRHAAAAEVDRAAVDLVPEALHVEGVFADHETAQAVEHPHAAGGGVHRGGRYVRRGLHIGPAGEALVSADLQQEEMLDAGGLFTAFGRAVLVRRFEDDGPTLVIFMWCLERLRASQFPSALELRHDGDPPQADSVRTTRTAQGETVPWWVRRW